VPRKRSALAEHCAAIGRNVNDITTSIVVRTASGYSNDRIDLAQVVEQIHAYHEAGCQIAFVEALAPDAREGALEIERLTEACLPLAGQTPQVLP